MSFSLVGQTSRLSNFRIENSYKDRVYFDVSGDISGLTKQGFVISGKLISSINTSGNYFTVTTAFTFWDNNTIRLGETSDSSDRQAVLHNFNLEYIENNISEPDASTYRYVSSTASGSGNGISEANPWTFEQAGNLVEAGMTVWCKAGDYGNINVTINKNGTVNSPIKFIGYTNEIGDDPKLDWSYPNNVRF